MKKYFALILFLSVFGLAHAADINIPGFEMLTLGRSRDGRFSLSSSVSADITLSGGYKYGLSLGFSFSAADLAKSIAYRDFQYAKLIGDPSDPLTVGDYNDLVDAANGRLAGSGIFSFNIMEASVRDMFGLPLDFSFFIGEGDDFCSGDEFSKRFGSEPVGTYYRGLFYFPDGIGGDMRRQYHGIYGARGTGFSLAFTKWNNMLPVLYIYENFPLFLNLTGDFGKPFYSGDLRFLLNHSKIKMDAFFPDFAAVLKRRCIPRRPLVQVGFVVP